MTSYEFPPELISKLRDAKHIAVLTGAGVSAESGIPTFRDAQTGLWAKYDPHELATPQAFQRNPQLVWEWYAWRRELIANVGPNPAHYALVDMERHAPHFTLITQNVDGLHRAAGSQHILELHGNIARTKRWTDGVVVAQWKETGEVPPRCPETGSLLRPDVVWFGEILPEDVLNNALYATGDCDFFLVAGTSATVHPAAALPELALRSGATVLIVNIDVTQQTTPPLYRLLGPAGEVLPALVQATWGVS